ncbi:hypothetical protein [Nonomuraea phyllanthi]|uniref:hypothetical protein n=1 Tax=Nonomuraea phyllanthi TaxID=2219224 RepID=UPI001292FB84|nr:hypothetical protein [Nonomuraea phyllanthi]
MEDAAEPVSSAYVQAGDSLWICDRIGDSAQRGCLVQGLVGSVLMAFVPDEAAIESSWRQDCTHRSMTEFIRGIRMPVSTVVLPASARTPSMRAGNSHPDLGAETVLGSLHRQIHHQVPDRLDDPARARVRGGAEHADTSGGVLDDRQDVQAPAAESDGLDEVAGQ